MKDQIASHRELIMVPAVVVRISAPGTLEAQLRTDLDRRADPMTPGDGVL